MCPAAARNAKRHALPPAAAGGPLLECISVLPENTHCSPVTSIGLLLPPCGGVQSQQPQKKLKLHNQHPVLLGTSFPSDTAVPAVAAAALRVRRAAAARAPATPAICTSRRILGNSGNLRHQLGATGPSYTSLGSNPPAISISGRNPHTSRYPALPTQHPAHPSAQPAGAGVRSDSPHPAERTNEKTAGSPTLVPAGMTLLRPARFPCS